MSTTNIGSYNAARDRSVSLTSLRFTLFSTRNFVFLLAVLAMNYTISRPSPVDMLYIASFLITLFYIAVSPQHQITRRAVFVALLVGTWAVSYIVSSLPHLSEPDVIFELTAKTFAISIARHRRVRHDELEPPALRNLHEVLHRLVRDRFDPGHDRLRPAARRAHLGRTRARSDRRSQHVRIVPAAIGDLLRLLPHPAEGPQAAGRRRDADHHPGRDAVVLAHRPGGDVRLHVRVRRLQQSAAAAAIDPDRRDPRRRCARAVRARQPDLAGVHRPSSSAGSPWPSHTTSGPKDATRAICWCCR